MARGVEQVNSNDGNYLRGMVHLMTRSGTINLCSLLCYLKGRLMCSMYLRQTPETKFAYAALAVSHWFYAHDLIAEDDQFIMRGITAVELLNSASYQKAGD